MFNIRTYNKISNKGLERFPTENYSVSEDESHPQGILLRSQKLHDESLPESVFAVARAGAGAMVRWNLVFPCLFFVYTPSRNSMWKWAFKFNALPNL